MRAQGDVPMAPEMRHAAIFVGMLVVMGGLGTYTLQLMGTLFVRLWGSADDFGWSRRAPRASCTA